MTPLPIIDSIPNIPSLTVVFPVGGAKGEAKHLTTLGNEMDEVGKCQGTLCECKLISDRKLPLTNFPLQSYIKGLIKPQTLSTWCENKLSAAGAE